MAATTVDRRLRRIERRLKKQSSAEAYLRMQEEAVKMLAEPLQVPSGLAALGPALVAWRRAILSELVERCK